MSNKQKIHNLIKRNSGKFYTAEISWRVFGESDYPRNNAAYGILTALERDKKVRSKKIGKNRFWYFRAQ